MPYYKLNTDSTIQSANKEHDGFSPMSELSLDSEGNYYSHYLADGTPDTSKITLVVLEATQAEFRATRNTLLSEVDIEINIAVDAGLDVAELRAYRQALRDATKLWVMPEPIVDAGAKQSAIWNEGRPL